MNFSLFKYRFKADIFVKSLVLTTVIVSSYLVGTGINMALKLSDNYLSGIWCAVSATVVFDDLPGNAKKLIKDRLLGTLIGAVLTTATLFVSENVLLATGISLFFTCMLITLFKWEGALKIGCITVLIIGVTAHGKGINEVWESGLMRFLESAAGGLISLLATIIIYKSKKLHLEDILRS